jgi:hypothetical protein
MPKPSVHNDNTPTRKVAAICQVHKASIPRSIGRAWSRRSLEIHCDRQPRSRWLVVRCGRRTLARRRGHQKLRKYNLCGTR